MEFQKTITLIFNTEEMNKFNDFYDLIFKIQQEIPNEDKEICALLHDIAINLDDLATYIED